MFFCVRWGPGRRSAAGAVKVAISDWIIALSEEDSGLHINIGFDLFHFGAGSTYGCV
jgi:hypothetical protein